MRVEVSSKEPLMTIQEFALAIYRSIETVRGYIKTGKLNYVQPHKYAHRRIPISELKKFGIRWDPYKWAGW